MYISWAPKCHLCNGILNIIYGVVYQHSYKQSCGFGFSNSSPNTKCGVDIPKVCSGCHKKYNHSDGHIFTDHKTAICKECIIGFNNWKQKLSIIDVKCPKCKIIFNPRKWMPRDNPYCIVDSIYYHYNFQIGTAYRFDDGVYKYAGNLCWSGPYLKL